MNIAIRSALALYDRIWWGLLPFLRRNARLQEGFEQRALEVSLDPADIWLQAASVGEVYLALELIQRLHPAKDTRILVTTNTRQGMDIIGLETEKMEQDDLPMRIRSAYCPFDRPTIMQKAVKQVRPQVMILLESEIWPALMATLKQAGTPVLIVNGRMTARSLKRYRIWPQLWRRLRPAEVLAISAEDAARFGDLFGRQNVSVMPNIKFDRLDTRASEPDIENGLRQLLPSGQPFAVFGSIRQAEEEQVVRMLKTVRAGVPGAIIGLFPRHSHRLSFWRHTLDKMDTAWTLRSQWHRPLSRGGVVLWDTFGELGRAYAAARAAFVGGSLAPLGGQNFLEPLICGVRPVIGPHWDNFKWVGDQIFEQDLVRRVEKWQAAAATLMDDLVHPVDRNSFGKTARAYLHAHQGGTEQACRVVRQYLRFNGR